MQLIIEAKERAASEGDFLKWCATAYRALTGSVTEARDLINKQQTERHAPCCSL